MNGNDELVWQFNGKGNMRDFIRQLTRATEEFGNKAKASEDKAIAGQIKFGAAARNTVKEIKAINFAYNDQRGIIQRLESTLDSLRDKQRRAFDTKQLADYNRQIEAITRRLADARGLGIAPGNAPVIATRRGFGGMGRAGDFLGQMPGGLGMLGSMGANPYVLGGAVVAGGVAFSNQAANAYLSYDKLISKANVTARLNPASREKLKRELMGIDYIGGNIEDVPIAFNQAISANGDYRQSLDIVKTAVKGSRAGFADLPTVTAALTSTMNQLKATGANASAQDVLDSFVMGQRLGAVEFGQLSNDLPGLLAARPKGTNYKDVVGSYSYLSTVLPVQEANTDLLNLLNALNKPEAKDRFKKEKVALFGAKGEALGFLKVLDNIYARYKSFKTEKGQETFLGNIIPDSQAAGALRSIFADYQKFKQTTGALQNPSGETDTALKFAISDQDVIDQAKNAKDLFLAKWGEVTAPIKLDIYSGLAFLFSDDKGQKTMIANKFSTQFKQLEAAGLRPSDFTKGQAPGIRYGENANGSTTLTSGQLAAYSTWYNQRNVYPVGRTAQENFKKQFGMGRLGVGGAFGLPSQTLSFAPNDFKTPSITGSNIQDTTEVLGRAPAIRNVNITIREMNGIKEAHVNKATDRLDEAGDISLNSLMRVVNAAERMI